MKKIKSLQIIGRRWFQKTYGNTYHAVKVEEAAEKLLTNLIYRELKRAV